MRVEHEIFPLTGLRFAAAFLLFLFHIHLRWPLAGEGFVHNILSQGAVGMSVFFMLSGFLLAYRYADGKTTYRHYILNRFARIYPVYVVAALVTIPWFGDVYFWKGVAIVLADVFLLQAWFPRFFHYWNNGASWSLSVEAFCYVLLPFMLAKLTPLSNRRLITVAVAAYLLGSLPAIYATFFPSALNKGLYIMPIFRLPEFALGACLYLLLTRGYALKRATWLQGVALLGLLAYLGMVGGGLQLYVGHNWVVLPVIGLFLVTLTHGKGLFAQILGSRIGVWLGKISYCFYSFQPLVILSLISYHDTLVAKMPLFANIYYLAIAAFTVLLGLSALGYYWAEEPLRDRIRRSKILDKP